MNNIAKIALARKKGPFNHTISRHPLQTLGGNLILGTTGSGLGEVFISQADEIMRESGGLICLDDSGYNGYFHKTKLSANFHGAEPLNILNFMTDELFMTFNPLKGLDADQTVHYLTKVFGIEFKVFFMLISEAIQEGQKKSLWTINFNLILSLMSKDQFDAIKEKASGKIDDRHIIELDQAFNTQCRDSFNVLRERLSFLTANYGNVLCDNENNSIDFKSVIKNQSRVYVAFPCFERMIEVSWVLANVVFVRLCMDIELISRHTTSQTLLSSILFHGSHFFAKNIPDNFIETADKAKVSLYFFEQDSGLNIFKKIPGKLDITNFKTKIFMKMEEHYTFDIFKENSLKNDYVFNDMNKLGPGEAVICTKDSIKKLRMHYVNRLA